MALTLSSDHDDDDQVDDEEGDVDGEVVEVDELDLMEDGLLHAESPAPAAEPPTPVPQRSKQKHSIAHDDIIANHIVYIHVDVEDGGDECGLLQLSTVFFDHEFKTLGYFDSFIRPPEGAKWNVKACEESHGYKEDDDFIVNAPGILDV
ncbi:hypothetical protein ACHAWF_012746 [Thalassiosira exigua]